MPFPRLQVGNGWKNGNGLEFHTFGTQLALIWQRIPRLRPPQANSRNPMPGDCVWAGYWIARPTRKDCPRAGEPATPGWHSSPTSPDIDPDCRRIARWMSWKWKSPVLFPNLLKKPTSETMFEAARLLDQNPVCRLREKPPERNAQHHPARPQV